ncbi:MAG: ABC transporter ATP-binding protein [Candidatus Abyssobacteria bacterium SURF_17]|uniref:ABC transporter ATP-binding protein n=1 Tax=Candidatus Abyssobacteria bacterium SURF_17 TaxID=2093361 RepID=A0A419F066_9BACT|nr:MAG: ABC transporter ATP-binding protein [Candidatus Abyssubacteria bacterium SURF_17]
MDQYVVALRGVTKVYGSSDVEVHALRGISVGIHMGEFVSIVGPSGSGKTTLMDIIGCLSRPTSGEYYLGGKDVSRLNDDALAEIRNNEIGFVFQTFNLIPRLTALQNVELPLVYAGVPARERFRRAQELLESVGLAERIHHKPSALSGGEVQRVAVARALVNRPSLILADEPTGNLDSTSEAEIIALLKDLHDKGNTIIIVTHNPSVAGQAQRTISLKDGHVVSDLSKAPS